MIVVGDKKYTSFSEAFVNCKQGDIMTFVVEPDSKLGQLKFISVMEDTSNVFEIIVQFSMGGAAMQFNKSDSTDTVIQKLKQLALLIEESASGKYNSPDIIIN